jgi:hypothetical protein
LIGAAGGELSVIVPINGFAGFGTYETGVALGMQSVGVALSSSLAGAVNLHFVSLGTAIVAGACRAIHPVAGPARKRAGPRAHDLEEEPRELTRPPCRVRRPARAGVAAVPRDATGASRAALSIHD